MTPMYVRFLGQVLGMLGAGISHAALSAVPCVRRA